MKNQRKQWIDLHAQTFIGSECPAWVPAHGFVTAYVPYDKDWKNADANELVVHVELKDTWKANYCNIILVINNLRPCGRL